MLQSLMCVTLLTSMSVWRKVPAEEDKIERASTPLSKAKIFLVLQEKQNMIS